jgi:hypothetical protein
MCLIVRDHHVTWVQPVIKIMTMSYKGVLRKKICFATSYISVTPIHGWIIAHKLLNKLPFINENIRDEGVHSYIEYGLKIPKVDVQFTLMATDIIMKAYAVCTFSVGSGGFIGDYMTRNVVSMALYIPILDRNPARRHRTINTLMNVWQGTYLSDKLIPVVPHKFLPYIETFKHLFCKPDNPMLINNDFKSSF